MHPLVQKNWDKKKTLKENYEALGLLSHLNGYAGGQMVDLLRQDHNPNPNDDDDACDIDNIDNIDSVGDDGKKFVKLNSDAIEWKTIEQMDKEKHEKELNKKNEKENNPLVTLLAPLEPEIELDDHIVQIGAKVSLKKVPVQSTIAPDSLASKVINQMREESQNARKMYRFQSEQETLVFEALLEKYGVDFGKMARDRKLNSYQLSEGQLRKKFSRCLQPLTVDEVSL